MGASEKQREEPASAVAMRKVSVFGASVTKQLVTHPSHLLFYTGTAGALVGLYVGRHISISYWLLLVALGFIDLCSWAMRKREAETAKPREK